jgi:hypothetical protein
MSTSHDFDHRTVIAGIVLRSALVLILRERGGPMTVQQLCRSLDAAGFRTKGRASKDISDALRWEVDRGRVRRVARSTYRVGHVARQTAWRMRRRLAEHHAHSADSPG